MAQTENPDKFADKYRVSSSRLKNWNYSTPGYYFITICTYNHNNFFGKIINGKINLSKSGEIAKNELLKTFEIRKNIKSHQWVIMPNHIHILMEIINEKSNNNNCRDVARYVSTDNKNNSINFSNISPKSNSISSIIRSFKSAVTKQINPQSIFFSWQPRFHDHLIKDHKEFLLIKKYIQNNIKNWKTDKYFSKS